jgi:hypothetical protein
MQIQKKMRAAASASGHETPLYPFRCNNDLNKAEWNGTDLRPVLLFTSSSIVFVHSCGTFRTRI